MGGSSQHPRPCQPPRSPQGWPKCQSGWLGFPSSRAGAIGGGKVPWAPHPLGLGGPCQGARLVLGSILPTPQPCANAQQPSACWGVGWKGLACFMCSLPLPLCLPPRCSPQLPLGRTDPVGSILPPPIRLTAPRAGGWSQQTALVTVGKWLCRHPDPSPMFSKCLPWSCSTHTCPSLGWWHVPMSALSMSPLCVSALPAQSVPRGAQQARCE